MTEIEELKAQIKVLEKKLSFLEEMENHKTPCEIAYKDWRGIYPGTGTWDSFDATRWIGFEAGYNAAYEEKVSEWKPTPQTPEQVADGLKEAFREAVKQGIIPEIKRPTDELIEKLTKKPPEFLKFELGKTLEDIVHKWWQCIFSTDSDWDCDTCIDDLIDQVELFLPREQDASGSQNTYAVAAVEGFNDAIKKIKSKLRNKKV